jgi:hypothetical protein
VNHFLKRYVTATCRRPHRWVVIRAVDPSVTAFGISRFRQYAANERLARIYIHFSFNRQMLESILEK